MSEGEHKVTDVVEEPPEDRDSLDARRARNRAKLDAARERARLTVETMHERRRRAVQAWASTGEVPHDVVMAAARERAAADGMSTEVAYCLIQSEGQTKH